jgi:hypothetical protein
VTDHVAGGNGQPLPDRRADAKARLEHARHALRRAQSEHALALAFLDEIQAATEQRRIDSETAATTRSVWTLTDDDALRSYPALGVLDPYFLATTEPETLLEDVLDAALTNSSAEMANVQLFDPGRRRLHLTAHRGFEQPFLDFFEWVDDEGSACAAASAQRAQIIVPDVEHSQLFSGDSREVMLDARVVAVQSAPLVSASGRLFGVISCHYNKPGRPPDEDMKLVSVLARAVVRSLQWQGHQPGNGAAHNGTHLPTLGGDRGVLMGTRRP